MAKAIARVDVPVDPAAPGGARPRPLGVGGVLARAPAPNAWVAWLALGLLSWFHVVVVVRGVVVDVDELENFIRPGRGGSGGVCGAPKRLVVVVVVGHVGRVLVEVLEVLTSKYDPP